MRYILDLDQAIQFLDAIGCTDDPIQYKGEETNPSSLTYWEEGAAAASGIKIKFYKVNNCQSWATGTLFSMVRDRLREYRLG